MQGEPAKSVLFVPSDLGGRRPRTSSRSRTSTGRTRSASSDVRLLTTLAGSLSVALENARLVHETRQRNAELALINSVQDAIAGELDSQAIYDAVGDRIQEIFDAQGVDIAISTRRRGSSTSRTSSSGGSGCGEEPRSPVGFSKHVVETRESLLIVENLEASCERYGSPRARRRGAEVGAVRPAHHRRQADGRDLARRTSTGEHAFSESDQQLLETLAGSLSVALENARLVHETRQRNAELALINERAGGDRGRARRRRRSTTPWATGSGRSSTRRPCRSTRSTRRRGSCTSRMSIERGERLHVEPAPPGGFTRHVLETREPLLITENLDSESERYGAVISAGEAPKSVLFVPLVVGGKATGAISLQNVDREHAFTESDEQLLETLAGSLSVALENARLVHETRQRNAELALINSVQDAIAGELDTQAIYDARRRQDPGDLRRAGRRRSATVDEATGLHAIPVHHRAGRAAARRACASRRLREARVGDA